VSTAAPALSSGEISDWLNRMAHRLSGNLVGAARDEIVAALRREVDADAHAPFRVLATLALLDDCLRVAHLATRADQRPAPGDLAPVLPLAAVAAPRYFMVVPHYQAFGEAEPSEAELSEFLLVHRAEAGAVDGPWRGLSLCRRVAELAADEDVVRDHERMLVRVMDAVGSGKGSAEEQAGRLVLRELFEAGRPPGADPRIAAFCRTDAPEVFSSVAHGAQVFERDPFDVEAIHADARAVFQSQLERAITPSRHEGSHGRTLLVLGGAGSGKTHLLRALRGQVHGQRLGYVGYLQMSSDVGDYARYVLAKLVDSLGRAYDAPTLAESGLLYLSDGLVEHGGALPAEAIADLRAKEIDPSALPVMVGRLVDRLMRTDELKAADSDLLQALLLLQRRDPALERRVVKYLRCEPLTPYEQELLGGLAARTQPEDPGRTIEQLGKLMFDLHGAALVVLVDQIEDAIPDAKGYERIQRALDVVRRISDALPSAIVLIACLDDVYERIRSSLTKSLIDRLEHDPAPIRLAGQRSREEIEWMLVRRLQHLYQSCDVAWRQDDPLFPFRSADLDERANSRARDCLLFFHTYQARCIAAGDLVEPTSAAPERPALAPEPALDDLERAWNDAAVQAAELPEDDASLLALVERGVRGSAEEAAIDVRASLAASGPRLRLTIALPQPGSGARLVEVCNRQAQGGHLAAQIDALRRGAALGQIPVALRTSDFGFGRKTMTARAIGQLVASGGLALSVEHSELRAAAAFEAFAARHGQNPEFAEWRRRARPLAQLPLFRKLLDLDRDETSGHSPSPESPPPRKLAVSAARSPGSVAPTASSPGLPAQPKPATSPSPAIASSSAPARSATGPVPRAPVAPPLRPLGAVSSSARLRLGVTLTMRAEPVFVEVEQLRTHAAFLGATGSGKTTLALHVVEQLLERGVPALLVDRKGDLARYASDAWWDEVPPDAEAARRKRELRARVEARRAFEGDRAHRAAVDGLLERGRASCNQEERRPYYHRLHEVLAEDQPVIFLYFRDALPVVASRVHGIDPSTNGIMYNFTEWFVPKRLQRYAAN